MEILIFAIIAAVVALGFAALRVRDVMAVDEGNDVMKTIARAIQAGASTFLKREYTFLAVFVAVVFVVLLIFIDFDVLGKFDDVVRWTSVSYLVGAVLSASAGYAGMLIAVRANVRTAAKAQEGLNPALRVAFGSGTVMGMTVVGLGLLGLVIMYLIWQSVTPLAGFAFGASSIALFARVGGGIFTKAADVGADLVGKVEAGIPEDDPRNPATIADNVGDNVGDVAGMGADLFESYVGSMVATMARFRPGHRPGLPTVDDWNWDDGLVRPADADCRNRHPRRSPRYIPGSHRRRGRSRPAALGAACRRLWRIRTRPVGERRSRLPFSASMSTSSSPFWLAWSPARSSGRSPRALPQRRASPYLDADIHQPSTFRLRQNRGRARSSSGDCRWA